MEVDMDFDDIPKWALMMVVLVMVVLGVAVLVVGVVAVLAGVQGAEYSPTASGLMSAIFTTAVLAVLVIVAAGLAVAVWKAMVWVVPSVIQQDRHYPILFATLIAVPLGAILNETFESKVATFTATFVLSLVSYLAAELLKHKAWLGLTVYGLIGGAVIAIPIWRGVDIEAWLRSLSTEELISLASVTFAVLALAAIVVVAETHYRLSDWLTLPRRRNRTPGAGQPL